MKVFVSSVINGLVSCRQKLLSAIERAGYQVEAMENWHPKDIDPIVLCQNKLCASNIYVGIITSQYGSPVHGQNCSTTELEYDIACRNGLPCLIWFASSKYEKRKKIRRKSAFRNAKRQRIFKDKINGRLFRKTFDQEEELIESVIATLEELKPEMAEAREVAEACSHGIEYTRAKLRFDDEAFCNFYEYAFSKEGRQININKIIDSLATPCDFRIRVSGNKGVGKTTFLMGLCELCKKRNMQTMYINLRKEYLRNNSIEDLCKNYPILNCDDTILFLDGLYDEGPVSSRMERLYADISKITQNKRKIVVATKTESGAELCNADMILKLKPLDRTSVHIGVYIEKYLKLRGSSTTVESVVKLLKRYCVLELDVSTLDFICFAADNVTSAEFSTVMRQYLASKFSNYRIEQGLSFEHVLAYAERYSVLTLSNQDLGVGETEYRCSLMLGGGTLIRRFMVARRMCNNILNGRIGNFTFEWPVLLENENQIIKLLANESSVPVQRIIGDVREGNGLIGLDEQIDRRLAQHCSYSLKEVSKLFEIKAQLAYIMGRVATLGEERERLIARLKGIKDKIAEYNRQYPLCNDVLFFLRRTVGISINKLDARETWYLDVLLIDNKQDELNRGFHLEYYGDQDWGGHGSQRSVRSHRDRLLGWDHTFSHLEGKIQDAVLDAESDNQRLSQVRVEIQTLVSLALHRHRRERLEEEKRTKIVVLIAKILMHPENIYEAFRNYLEAAKALLSIPKIPFGLELLLLYRLKTQQRAGWKRRIQSLEPERRIRIESVAEHLYGCYLIGELYLPPTFEGSSDDALPNKEDDWSDYRKESVISTLLMHDWAESVVTDIPSDQKTDIDRTRQDFVQKTLLLFDFFDDIFTPRSYYALWRQAESGAYGCGINSKLVKDIDRLELLVQLYCVYRHEMDQKDFNKLKGYEEKRLQTTYVNGLWEKLRRTLMRDDLRPLIDAWIAVYE